MNTVGSINIATTPISVLSMVNSFLTSILKCSTLRIPRIFCAELTQQAAAMKNTHG